MTHIYKVTGMTCANCQATVQRLLSGIKGVQHVEVDLAKEEATINMSTHIETSELQRALSGHPKFSISEKNSHMTMAPASDETDEKSWWETYKPIVLIFLYILAVTLSIEGINNSFNWMRWMKHFMAGFFLIFSFFKLLDITGFADSYSTYDIVAKKWRAWGYLYAFIELGLGFAYLTGVAPVITAAITFVVMGISIIGVLQSVLNKRKIRCACLGAVFNLPMSTVTIIEDALMIAMSAVMLFTLLF